MGSGSSQNLLQSALALLLEGQPLLALTFQLGLPRLADLPLVPDLGEQVCSILLTGPSKAVKEDHMGLLLWPLLDCCVC